MVAMANNRPSHEAANETMGVVHDKDAKTDKTGVVVESLLLSLATARVT